jgi:hypothetical protein
MIFGQDIDASNIYAALLGPLGPDTVRYNTTQRNPSAQASVAIPCNHVPIPPSYHARRYCVSVGVGVYAWGTGLGACMNACMHACRDECGVQTVDISGREDEVEG